MKRLLAAILLLLLFANCSTFYSVQKSESRFYVPSENNSLKDTTFHYITDPYREKLNETMNEVLAKAKEPLEKGQPESALGNFVADLCFQTGNRLYKSDDGSHIDFCVLNNGGLRSMLPAGEITRRHVYELMPFDNELVVVTLTPDSVRSLLNFISEKGGVPVSNIRFNIISGFPENIIIGNTAINNKKTYKVITSDYLANGGDAMMMLNGAIKTESLGIKLRDAIIDYLTESSKIQPYIIAGTDGRISK